MNTLEARSDMRDLAAEAHDIIERLMERGKFASGDKQNLRRMATEARTILVDAGYPGEAVWRGLQRASISAETLLDDFDRSYWADVDSELEAGRETLEALVSTDTQRDTDLHVVG